MSDEQKDRKIEIIHPPNRLKARVSVAGGGGGIDNELLRRAESAVARYTSETDFAEDIHGDIIRLQEALTSLERLQDNQAEFLMAMYEIAHDIRGVGETFGYPIASRLANSLCRFLEGRMHVSPAEKEILGAHIDALSMVIERKLQGDGGDDGRDLVEAIESLVEE
ncbi:hypothetical protein [Oceanibaculum pacificum]|uniref:HPt domain-containing protein n=1 Tax=Oceanibaculum pacificum TaxID=580166 RepID=A0A154WCX3_9PROT|nr:hypothetical protein [Oceanibaculum pacificum]KZD11369.1 hypothetical protein AUP43_18135 [Oceanibaculum pacificum]